MRRLAALAGLLLVAVGALAFPAAPASAAGEVTVREVDTFDFPEVRLEVLVAGGTVSADDFSLRENGSTVPDLTVRRLGETTKAVGTVLVIDTSGSMRSQGAMEAARAAARTFVEDMGPHEWVAVVSFSSEAVLRSRFTQDRAALVTTIDALTATGETALWDGLITAAQLLDDRPELQPNIVFLSDGADTVSSASETDAVSAVTDSHAAVFGIAISSDEFNPQSLNGFVEGTDGSLASSADPAQLENRFGAIRQALENQYAVSYRSKGDGGTLDLDLNVAGESVKVQTRAGTVGIAAAPDEIDGANGPLNGWFGRGLIVLMAFGAAGLFGFSMMAIFGGPRKTGLDERLEGYGGRRPVSADGSAAEPEIAPSPIVRLKRRAVDLTSQVANRAGLLTKVEALLDQTNLPLRPAEALCFYAAIVGVALVLALLGAPNVAAGLVMVGLAASVPVVAVKRMRKKRLLAFEKMLPDTLTLLAGSLRAGYSFLQGVEAVAQETDEPMAGELRRAIAEARLGRPMEEALGDIGVRMASQDFEWAVMAIRIQREVGGNLAELLQTVAETMNQRTRLRGEVKALTAEGRMSAIVVALLPIAIGGYMSMVAPEYIGTLFSSTVGWIMVGGSGVLAAAGFVWLRKIVNIEV